MEKEKKLIIGSLILFLTLVIFLYYTVYLPEKERIVLDDPVALKGPLTPEHFSGSPIINGNFVKIDFEINTLYLETYDSQQRQDVVVLIEITEETIFKKTTKDLENYLILDDYVNAFEKIIEGDPLKVFVDDFSKERPKAFVVEIDGDYPFFPQPAIMDSF